jgi:hypothetical protein
MWFAAKARQVMAYRIQTDPLVVVPITASARHCRATCDTRAYALACERTDRRNGGGTFLAEEDDPLIDA